MHRCKDRGRRCNTEKDKDEREVIKNRNESKGKHIN
jgi:hypothetical protein